MDKILVLCDDYWHPSEVVQRGLEPLSDRYDFTFIKDAKDTLTQAFIASYPLIICCKANHINASNTHPWFEENVTEVGVKELEAYVAAGNSFFSIHSGNTARFGNAYGEFTGSFFEGHPPRCQVELKMDKNHVISNNIPDFSIRDEQYQMKVVASDAEIFCETRSDSGGTQVGGFSRAIGSGRLCALMPGHTLSVWLTEEYQQLLVSCIEWCLRRK